ncbi:MAG: hypothetical protein HY964_03085 [Ignavibacteriales bacterium]|nr:hypothetical protein [Ignavibacteriales bacterium]
MFTQSKWLIILFIVAATLHAQTLNLNKLSNITKRDSSDKLCKILFDDFYDSFESDEGLGNSKITKATINLFRYSEDTLLQNRQLAELLYGYINSVSKPDTALEWIRVLKEEYPKVYGQLHPLILLYEGESLINSKRINEAHQHFLDFYKLYPSSVMAMVYIFETETNPALSKTWLSILKRQHPNHWVVKNLK